MAQHKNLMDKEKFCCSICLDLLTDPVTIPCGHSYCMNCIKTQWDLEDTKQIHSCPQCRQTFTPRPSLVKSTMLADLVAELKKIGLQAAPSDHSYAEPEDVDEHKGHNTISAAAERTERQKELEVSQENIQQRIQDREKDVKLLQHEVEAISQSADKAVEDSEKLFTELICLIQKSCSDVKQQIRSQQETEVSRVKELQEKLEVEITELKRKDTELKALLNTEDHNQFLQNYLSLSALTESTESSSINIRPLGYFEVVTTAVSEVRDRLQHILREKCTDISLIVTEVDVLLSDPQAEPKRRAGFLKLSHEITLDPNTANTWLLLSERNRKTTAMNNQQPYSDHPDRFTDYWQVLSTDRLTGRCYWEVEWRGGVHVAVAYKNINRAGMGNECGFGGNARSWALKCSQNSYTFWHNNIQTPISGPQSSRIGVYLDHCAGILSFYSISETMTLLHRVQTTFTQPLHAGLRLNGWCVFGASAKFCELKHL
ncbi:tripartite motif-containing protein 16-like protein [Simochromis diagramma]|uniref:tripartite motif-containing protein 16-like protein n=1 Tax=Simochromis diagramma TaxID=43689 RepID=UPI001A7E9DB2|nr:tripartite motif-containing protein 16-like protein [Simochromis diagramma]